MIFKLNIKNGTLSQNNYQESKKLETYHKNKSTI
jgi:hypothetical protein